MSDDDMKRLQKRAERLREINIKTRAEILRLRESNKRKDTEIGRLEGEVKSLVEVIEPGSWDQKKEKQ